MQLSELRSGSPCSSSVVDTRSAAETRAIEKPVPVITRVLFLFFKYIIKPKSCVCVDYVTNTSVWI